MEETTTPTSGDLPGLVVEAVEWLPSGAESGLVRVRGRWTQDSRAASLPALRLRAAGQDHRFESLPDARFGRDADSWRGSYLVPSALVAADPEELWLEWRDGRRARLGRLTRDVPPAPASGGGQVIDRAVLAERRTRRAEAAERAQARVAAEALKAVEALELRARDLERRLQEAVAQRDALAERTALADTAEEQRRALAAALETGARLRAQARGWRLHLRASEVARSTDAVRLAVLEAERASADDKLQARLEAQRRAVAEREEQLASARAEAAAARAELDGARDDAAAARAELDGARDDAAAARVESDAARQDADAARTELARAREEAAAARTELEAAGEEQRAVRAAAEAAVAEAEARRSDAEAAAAEAVARLEVDTVARAALEDELDRERASRAPLEADLDAALAARASAEDALAALRGDLAAATSARDTALTSLALADAALADAREARTEADRAGGALQARIAELEQGSSTDRLERLAREQADAAAARPASAPAHDLAARLDAAAEALRARTVPPGEAAAADEEAVVRPGEAAGAGEEATGGSVAPAPRIPRASLRRALVELAREDPDAAARLLASLLPAQGAVLRGPLSYDLTIKGLGTYAVTVRDGHALTEPLVSPRSRRVAGFHLIADPQTLAELLAGARHRVGRLRGPARFRGRRHRLEELRPLTTAPLTLTDVARAGVHLEPGLAWRALAHAVSPAWTCGMGFTVAHEATDGEPASWLLTVRDGRGLWVAEGPATRAPDATVRMSRAAFDRLLRQEPQPAGDRPAVRGDRDAVAALLALADRARG